MHVATETTDSDLTVVIAPQVLGALGLAHGLVSAFASLVFIVAALRLERGSTLWWMGSLSSAVPFCYTPIWTLLPGFVWLPMHVAFIVGSIGLLRVMPWAIALMRPLSLILGGPFLLYVSWYWLAGMPWHQEGHFPETILNLAQGQLEAGLWSLVPLIMTFSLGRSLRERVIRYDSARLIRELQGNCTKERDPSE